ncbi:hypothetical protein Taro_018094 [Colocasia esculenta]|uniref:Structural maintenance of chromosomes protein 5 n=1 Tax=Colocasia esculenta TaxID=4460 RepID=A0A843USV5_COLES|nr:hypothetical protein [Colocasia esculenta]
MTCCSSRSSPTKGKVVPASLPAFPCSSSSLLAVACLLVGVLYPISLSPHRLIRRWSANGCGPALSLPRGEDDYLPGNIVEIEIKNFMTYDHLKCKPGSRLNLVIGPNGSGKSSLVCAIALGLGGDPQVHFDFLLSSPFPLSWQSRPLYLTSMFFLLEPGGGWMTGKGQKLVAHFGLWLILLTCLQILGRASNVGAFVKRGEDSGSIKISLRGYTPDQQIIITRKIDTQKKSEWQLNGRCLILKFLLLLISYVSSFSGRFGNKSRVGWVSRTPDPDPGRVGSLDPADSHGIWLTLGRPGPPLPKGSSIAGRSLLLQAPYPIFIGVWKGPLGGAAAPLGLAHKPPYRGGVQPTGQGRRATPWGCPRAGRTPAGGVRTARTPAGGGFGAGTPLQGVFRPEPPRGGWLLRTYTPVGGVPAVHAIKAGPPGSSLPI